jgi:hypothetical protein
MNSKLHVEEYSGLRKISSTSGAKKSVIWRSTNAQICEHYRWKYFSRLKDEAHYRRTLAIVYDLVKARGVDELSKCDYY